jgi:phospholipid/cholesterol/gamma-HCH transport system substrate-binding protein
MAKLTQAAKVGIFVILSGAGVYFVYRTVSKEVGGGNGYTVHAYIADATGLANHSRVTIAGIPVGSIDSIRLENGKARIDVRVKNDVPLYDNATLGKKSASLLGESVIVLTPGTEDKRKLKDGDEVHVIVEQATTDQIIDEVKEIADRIKEVATQLARSIGTEKGGKNIEAILQNVADATDALNKTIREDRVYIDTTLKNLAAITTNADPQLARILENVRIVTEDVKDLMAATGQQPGKQGPGELRETIERLNRASKSLESALSHVDNVAGRIDRGEGTIGKLTKDEGLVNEVQGVAEGINDYVGNITRLQTIVGLRNDYNFLANTIKSYVELRLQPREDKYYVIELINDPRGKTSFTQTDVDTTNPNEPSHYRTVTTTTTDAFRFSLQFARRLGPFTGRFGIKESTGGIGVDVHLLENRFELTQDLFGFGEEVQPRYRVYIAYEFIKRLWLMGGVDHLFLTERRDYFLGLQLRFTDDDLKTILPFSGGAVGGAAR